VYGEARHVFMNDRIGSSSRSSPPVLFMAVSQSDDNDRGGGF
jgi:hypothetical protein